jgi:hypothetical protein
MTHYAGSKMKKPKKHAGFERSKGDKEPNGHKEGSKREERMDARQMARATIMGKGRK